MSISADTVIAFAAARLVEAPGAQVWIRNLHFPYLSWCASQGAKPLGYPLFAASLRGHLPTKEIGGRLHLLDRVLAS
jgi:hypothetical protein